MTTGLTMVALAVLCVGWKAARAEEAVSMKLTSAAFAEGTAIPKQHTCEGADLSPPLVWQGAPPATRAFALVCDDPDAPVGTWVHWVLYDLPGTVTQLAPGLPADDGVLGGKQGVNDFRKVGYGGPCPPPGKPHRYFFRLYALDSATGLRPRASKAEVSKAIQGHVLGEAQLMGTYQR
jgi:hypothetical protein